MNINSLLEFQLKFKPLETCSSTTPGDNMAFATNGSNSTIQIGTQRPVVCKTGFEWDNGDAATVQHTANCTVASGRSVWLVEDDRVCLSALYALQFALYIPI